MVIVLGLLNNISYGPQSGGTFCTQGGGVVAVSNLTAVIEKKAAISIGNGVLGKFNKVYLIQLSRWRGGKVSTQLRGRGRSISVCISLCCEEEYNDLS